ncbi:hypothetical protein EI94DRAFT_1705088 [Lactarius quietus]|nr:hypothetical protein EI94DRAFT_1705088 [Lactarius quietus]
MYCCRANATFIKHITNTSATAALQKHKPSLLPWTSDLTGDTPEGTASSQTNCLCSQTRPTRFSCNSVWLLAGDPLAVVYDGGWAEPEHGSSRTMIREGVVMHDIIRSLNPKHGILALQIDPAQFGIFSARGARSNEAVGGADEEGAAEVEDRGRRIGLGHHEGIISSEQGSALGSITANVQFPSELVWDGPGPSVNRIRGWTKMTSIKKLPVPGCSKASKSVGTIRKATGRV